MAISTKQIMGGEVRRIKWLAKQLILPIILF